jgi:hypothetical protein
MKKYKMNATYPKLAQIRHDQFHTFFCVLTASMVEAVTLHLYATQFPICWVFPNLAFLSVYAGVTST